jgi:hypothetical protein
MASKEWGTTRHGTHSGWSRHVKLKQDACDSCKKAKAEYDVRFRAADPQRLKSRLQAKAQGRAEQRLRKAHPTEYKIYYQEERAKLFREELDQKDS